VLQSARNSALIRFIPANADIASLSRLLNLDLLRLEGPENLYAFLRVKNKKQSVVIHLANWNFVSGAERAETYKHVTVTLLHPARWGDIKKVLWHEPDKKPVAIIPEQHADEIRLTLPQVAAWGIIEIISAP
jgi:hypothetical protein